MESDNSHDRFSNILSQALKYMPQHIDLGGNRKDIGTHSNRKGSATYALSVCMISAPAVFQERTNGKGAKISCTP